MSQSFVIGLSQETKGHFLGEDPLRIAVDSTRAADVDDAPRLAVLDPKVRRGCSHELERCSVVQGQDGVPLLVGHLVDHAVPREARIVDDDVNFAFSEFGRFGDQGIDVLGIEHVSCHYKRIASGVIDLSSYGISFGSVNILYDDVSSFLGKQPCCFCANALTGAGDDSGDK